MPLVGTFPEHMEHAGLQPQRKITLDADVAGDAIREHKLLTVADVQRALDRLQDEKLVWKVLGGRATRYDHNLDATWQLDRPAKAIVGILFLRGAQTAGELRSRAGSLRGFRSPSRLVTEE